MSLSYYREEEGKAAPLQLGRPSSLAPGVKLKNKTKKELAHILPDIFKIETYARPPHSCLFDRLDLLLNFIPGKDNIGAVFRTYINAIKIHDDIIKNIEESQTLVDALKLDFGKKKRLFQNYTNAWNVILPQATEYGAFKKLSNSMLSYDTDMYTAIELGNEGRQFQLIEKKKKYTAMRIRNAPTEQLEEAILVAKGERDEASVLLMKAEAILQLLLGDERVAAKQISDDHIYADEIQMSYTALFPNVHVGFILASVNDFDVENLKFSEVTRHIRDTKPPHLATFKRYDYRFDPFTLSWLSLQEYRDMDIFVDDPLLSRSAFVQLAASGTIDQIRNCLLEGDDPNSTDATECTAMHFAAGRGDTDMVDLLIAGGATVDARDTYMVTPYLLSIRRGQADMARHLISKGASMLATDRNGRGGLYEAVSTNSEELVKMLLNKGNYNQADSLWGFTSLHIAANQGNIPMLKQLLNYGCSIFRVCNNGFTAEIIALKAGQKEAHRLLEEERLTAPAQLVYTEADRELNIWIGDQSALEAVWSAEVGITHVLCFCDPDAIPRSEILAGTIPMSVQHVHNSPSEDLESSHIDDDEYDSNSNSGKYSSSNRYDNDRNNRNSNMTVPSYNDRNINASVPRSSSSSAQSKNRNSQHNNNNNNNSNEIKSNTISRLISKSKSVESNIPIPSPHFICPILNDDDDTSDDPWVNLSACLPFVIPYLLSVLKKGSTTLLLCDTSGDCLSPAVLSAALLLHKQIRTSETLRNCGIVRPSVKLSSSVRRGIDELQLTIDEKKLDRLNAKLRHSEILSLNF